ncbi:TP53-regulated inhibitor of apoptosis 1-A [Thelohanellus kitauei]|uniref:TP53-regulated inhibitor of apoptosis 1-A n=1 Tax=Thelohanellus kitauei TaxID=669202 RepID=A0A0C2J580_THEKT|nr:TP53-regulated inhibitor of apoptosis 1-A [Thelohanellus kitauei]
MEDTTHERVKYGDNHISHQRACALIRIKMPSISPECNVAKDDYDSCFENWYKNDFLNGNKNIEVCQELLDKYRECVQKVLKDKHIEVRRGLAEMDGLIEHRQRNQRRPF